MYTHRHATTVWTSADRCYKKDNCLLSAKIEKKKKKGIQRRQKVCNSYQLATILGLGLFASKMSKFQDTKMAVIAYFMSTITEFAVVESGQMEC